LPSHAAQSFGHLDLNRRNQRSTTKQTQQTVSITSSELPPSHSLQASNIFVKNLSIFDRLHVDAPGRFPVQSVHEFGYQLLLYSEATNYIHVELLKDRKAASYTAAYVQATEFFTSHYIPIKFVRLDNESSSTLLSLFKSLKIHAEVAPPHNHRTLHAERHIRTWKNHFIATLSTCDPTFPLAAWEFLIPQAECTMQVQK
jgi:hypothetical protein